MRVVSPLKSIWMFAAPQESAIDAVDGSSTGTYVPKMWVLLRLLRVDWPRERKLEEI